MTLHTRRMLLGLTLVGILALGSWLALSLLRHEQPRTPQLQLLGSVAGDIDIFSRGRGSLAVAVPLRIDECTIERITAVQFEPDTILVTTEGVESECRDALRDIEDVPEYLQLSTEYARLTCEMTDTGLIARRIEPADKFSVDTTSGWPPELGVREGEIQAVLIGARGQGVPGSGMSNGSDSPSRIGYEFVTPVARTGGVPAWYRLVAWTDETTSLVSTSGQPASLPADAVLWEAVDGQLCRLSIEPTGGYWTLREIAVLGPADLTSLPIH